MHWLANSLSRPRERAGVRVCVPRHADRTKSRARPTPSPNPPAEREREPRVGVATWEALFKSQGMKNPVPRAQMLDGFNEGWIDFEGDASSTRKGTVSLDTVPQALVARA
jgi:hypothetical protein